MYQLVSVCAQTGKGDVSFSVELSFSTSYSISASAKVQLMRNKSFHCLGHFTTLLDSFRNVDRQVKKQSLPSRYTLTRYDIQCIILTAYIYTRKNDCTREGVCNCTSVSFEIAKTHPALCLYDQRKEL